MRLTHRGKAVVLFVGLAVVLGWQFGSRALNAVAAPLAVALLAGTAQLYRASPPEIESIDPEPGVPGQTTKLSLSLYGDGIATIVLPETEGITGGRIDATVRLPYTLERTVERHRRGVYDLGPDTIRQQGPLGLIAREVDVDADLTLVVYPHTYELPRENALIRRFADDNTAERQEFDRLREYVPGDPLRNIHWKSSAKAEEFMVMEFASSGQTETVTIAGSAAPDCADEMAAAAATTAEVALEVGLTVELVVPDGSVGAGHGKPHRRELLSTLARTGSGVVPDKVVADADVVIRSDDDGTEIRIHDDVLTLEQLRGSATALEAVEVAP
jgi:uncharacterized protein (DUF58 family)